jgi:hypothetical protein
MKDLKQKIDGGSMSLYDRPVYERTVISAKHLYEALAKASIHLWDNWRKRR